MATTIERFADFAEKTSFDDLPKEVVSATKRLVLDTIGCALAGVGSDKGKWALGFARSCFGGNPQASVIGCSEKLSTLGAAFVNAELINGYDYDASGKHLPPCVMPATLAVAEMKRTTGKDFITAFALANEIGIRIGSGMSSFRDVVNGKACFPPVQGYSCTVYGGAAAVAKLEGFSVEMLADAMSFAGLIAPMQIQAHMVKSPRSSTIKAILAGWVSQAELTAAYLVRAGHRGDAENLDSEYGFWRYAGSTKWDSEKVLAFLGDEWRFIRAIPFKLYPCCRIVHGALDCLQSILNKNSIAFEEIEKIEAYLEASCSEPIFKNRNIRDQIDAQFSPAYNLAVMAYGIKPGAAWQCNETLQNPDIHQFMDRISTQPHPEYAVALREDQHARISRVKVYARGRVFGEERKFIRGNPSPDPSTFITDAELINKFRDNALPIMSPEQIEEAIDLLLNLETVEDMSAVAEILHC